MNLSIQHLRYFLAVAEELHFTRAAERLQIAPSSLSHQIAELERRVGVPLFRRTSRRVELTAAGGELVPLARDVVTGVEAVGAWADRRKADGEVVRIGLLVGTSLTAAVLNAAAETLPHVHWEVQRLEWTEPVQALHSGLVDVVITPGTSRPASGGVQVVPLWSEARVLVVSTRHRFAGRDSVRLDELTAERFVGIKTDAPGRAAWFGGDVPGVRVPEVDTLVSGFEEVLDHCAAGMGANIAGASAASTYPRPDVAYVPLPELPDVNTYLLRPAGGGAPATAAFAKVALDTVRRLGAAHGVRPPTG